MLHGIAAKMCPIGRRTKINTGALARCIFIIPNRCLFVNIVSRTFFFCFPWEATFFRYTDQLFLLGASTGDCGEVALQDYYIILIFMNQGVLLIMAEPQHNCGTMYKYDY